MTQGPDAGDETGGSAGTGGAANGGSINGRHEEHRRQHEHRRSQYRRRLESSGDEFNGWHFRKRWRGDFNRWHRNKRRRHEFNRWCLEFRRQEFNGWFRSEPRWHEFNRWCLEFRWHEFNRRLAPCTKDADCINLDPTNCSYTCVNPGTAGLCKPTATLTPTQCATSACEDEAISGFWDASGKPHIAYAWTESDGSATIRMQQVKADGAVVAYKVPSGQQAPILLSVNSKGGSVGLLWETTITTETTQAPVVEKVVNFATTDISGTYSDPTEIVKLRQRLPSESSDATMALRVTPAEASARAWNTATVRPSTMGSQCRVLQLEVGPACRQRSTVANSLLQ